MLDATAENFLWNVFYLGLIKNDSKQAIEWVASIYSRDVDLPGSIEKQLVDYWNSGKERTLFSLALMVLEKFYLNIEHQTRLIAFLFANGQVDLDKVYSILSFDDASIDGFRPSVRRIADIIWLLRQDSAAHIMEPSDDSLLSEALVELANEDAAMGG